MLRMILVGLVGAAATAAAVWGWQRLAHEYESGFAAGVHSMAEARIGRAESLYNYLKSVAPELEPHELARAMRLATR
jgi:hypothetical protein